MANFTSSYSTDPTDLNDFLNSTIWVEELCKELGAKSVTDVARDILVAAASEVTNPGSISSTRLLMGAIEVARNINSRRHADEDAVVLNCLGRILATEPSIAGNFEQLRISYRLQRNEGKSRKTVEVTTHAAGILSHAVLIRRSRYGAPTLTADAILAAIIGYPDGRFHKALAERGFSPKSLGKIVQRAIESVDAEYAIWWLNAAGIRQIQSLSDIDDLREEGSDAAQSNDAPREIAKNGSNRNVPASDTGDAHFLPLGAINETVGGDPTTLPRQSRATVEVLSGRAETLATTDLLDRKSLTAALSELILNRDSIDPFVIGLFGHWGAGKSSQVNFLRAALKHKQPSIEFIEFNAWKNEQVENLAAAFAQCVVEAIVAERSIIGRIKLAMDVAAARQRTLKKAATKDWHWLRSWLCLFVPVGQAWALLALFALIALYSLYSGGKLDGVQFGVTASLTAALTWYVAIKTFISGNLTDWFRSLISGDENKIIRLPNYRAKLGIVSEIHRTLGDICEAYTASPTDKDPKTGKYLLIVIDDLDRCEPKTVKEVLDIVRLVADIPRVVALVAVDERLAFGAVEKHYEQFRETGRTPSQVARDYLAKIMQVSVTLPAIGDHSVRAYIKEHLFDFQQSPPEVVNNTLPAESMHRNENASNSGVIADGAALEPTTTSELDQAISTIGTSATAVNTLQSLPEEHELFEQYALAFCFSNPRLLRRMFQAWRLLKSMTFGKVGYDLQDVKGWMPLLFWREWLLQQQPEARRTSEEWLGLALAQGAKPQPDRPSELLAISERIPFFLNEMNESLNATGNSYPQATLTVDCVLLPSIALPTEKEAVSRN